MFGNLFSKAEQKPVVKDEIDESKRNFMRGAVALAGTMIIGGKVVESVIEYTGESDVVEPFAQVETTPKTNVELIPHTEFEQPHFTKFVEAAALAKIMSREQVIFVNKETGALLKGPVQVQDAAGYTVSEMTWRYQGGEPVGISAKWSVPEKKKVSAEEGILVDDIEMQHSYLSLRREELGAVDSLQMAALFLLQNPVPDDVEKRSYNKFIDETFNPDFGSDTEIIQPELRRLLKSLIAKESLYSPTAKSNTGARGELQIMPATWKKYAEDTADPTNFFDELPVAVRYFEESYKYLMKHLRNEFDIIETVFFNGDHTAFLLDFLIPWLITGYNAGDGNVRHVIEWFMKHYPTVPDIQKLLKTDKPIEGKDFFYVMTRFAREKKAVPGFQEAASSYALDIYGWDKSQTDFKEEMKNLAAEIDEEEKKLG